MGRECTGEFVLVYHKSRLCWKNKCFTKSGNDCFYVQNMEEKKLQEIRDRESQQPLRPKSAPLGALQNGNNSPSQGFQRVTVSSHNEQQKKNTMSRDDRQMIQDSAKRKINLGESVTVVLKKGDHGFGFSIRGGEGMPLFVLKIAEGGATWQDGRVKVLVISTCGNSLLCNWCFPFLIRMFFECVDNGEAISEVIVFGQTSVKEMGRGQFQHHQQSNNCTPSIYFKILFQWVLWVPLCTLLSLLPSTLTLFVLFVGGRRDPGDWW